MLWRRASRNRATSAASDRSFSIRTAFIAPPSAAVTTSPRLLDDVNPVPGAHLLQDVGPQRHADFAQVGLPEQEHLGPGLADPPADGQRQRPLGDPPVVRKPHVGPHRCPASSRRMTARRTAACRASILGTRDGPATGDRPCLAVPLDLGRPGAGASLTARRKGAVRHLPRGAHQPRARTEAREGGPMYETIVLAVDGSEESTKAVPAAAQLAKRFHGEVIVVHVAEYAGRFTPDLEPEGAEMAAVVLDAVVRMLKDDGGQRSRRAPVLHARPGRRRDHGCGPGGGRGPDRGGLTGPGRDGRPAAGKRHQPADPPGGPAGPGGPLTAYRTATSRGTASAEAAVGPNASIMARTSSPSGYRIGQVQPASTYSWTLATHSSGVPDAEIICTASSGTSFMARWISSGPAGQVMTFPISSIRPGSTPLAFMMCGCWPRYWVSSSRAWSSARSRSWSSEHTISWGRSMSSTVRPARAAPSASASRALRLYGGPTM